MYIKTIIVKFQMFFISFLVHNLIFSMRLFYAAYLHACKKFLCILLSVVLLLLCQNLIISNNSIYLLILKVKLKKDFNEDIIGETMFVPLCLC